MLAALDDPVRRRLYRYVRGRGQPVTREEAAVDAGISRKLAAFHLDKLVDVGVLEVRYERTSGRTGPGAGRPSKLYRPIGELAASVPERHYDLAGGLLADAVAASARSGEPVADALRSVSREAGEALGREGGELVEVLRSCGYEP